MFGPLSGHVFGRKLFSLIWRFTSCPSYTKYAHFPQLIDLSCEVKYSHSAENYTTFHANISGAIQIFFFFFWWSPLLNGQIPKLWLSWSPHQTQNLPGIMWVLLEQVALGHCWCCSRACILSWTKGPSYFIHTHLGYLIEKHLSSSSSFPWSLSFPSNIRILLERSIKVKENHTKPKVTLFWSALPLHASQESWPTSWLSKCLPASHYFKLF